MNGTAPPLELRDIHAAPAPDIWPPAPGWWVLTVFLVLAFVVGGRLLLRWYHRHRRRRAVLGNLAESRRAFERDGSATELAAALSMLLRRVALARFPRDRVAGIQGEAWLRFLDTTGGAGRFLQGPGQVLVTAPYAPRAQLDVDALCALVKDWVLKNA